jgi:hypothetical protein
VGGWGTAKLRLGALKQATKWQVDHQSSLGVLEDDDMVWEFTSDDCL